MATNTRARMLETTARLLQHRGYHGTSLNDILQESDAPRGSLYFHFPGGKDQLVIEATRASVDEATDALRECLAASESPGRGFRMYLEAAAGLMHESEFAFGCPVAPVILDAAAGLPELAEICRGAFEAWVALIEDALKAADVNPPRAHALALLAVSSLEGLLLLARAYRDCTPLVDIAAELQVILDSALPEGTVPPQRARARA